MCEKGPPSGADKETTTWVAKPLRDGFASGRQTLFFRRGAESQLEVVEQPEGAIMATRANGQSWSVIRLVARCSRRGANPHRCSRIPSKRSDIAGTKGKPPHLDFNMKTPYTDHGTRHRPSGARRRYRDLRNALRGEIDDLEEGGLREPVRPLRVCHCDECVRLCRGNPGWFTPAEAILAMEAGLGQRLMRDWLEPSHKLGNDERIYVLSAASLGFEGRNAPEIGDTPEFCFAAFFLGYAKKGRCTFLENNRCAIHDSGFKPKQCRECLGCQKNNGPDNYEMARHWDTDEGRAALKMWAEIVQQPTPV